MSIQVSNQSVLIQLDSVADAAYEKTHFFLHSITVGWQSCASCAKKSREHCHATNIATINKSHLCLNDIKAVSATDN